MKLIPVESTTITTVGYDANSELLRIEFRDRTIYQYFGVPASVHNALMCASSKGKYFNGIIRGRFAFSLEVTNHQQSLS